MPWVDASANVHDSRPNRIPSSIVLVCFRDSFLDIVGIDTESALARIGIDLYRVYVRLPRKRTLAVGITGLKKTDSLHAWYSQQRSGQDERDVSSKGAIVAV